MISIILIIVKVLILDFAETPQNIHQLFQYFREDSRLLAFFHCLYFWLVHTR